MDTPIERFHQTAEKVTTAAAGIAGLVNSLAVIALLTDWFNISAIGLWKYLLLSTVLAIVVGYAFLTFVFCGSIGIVAQPWPSPKREALKHAVTSFLGPWLLVTMWFYAIPELIREHGKSQKPQEVTVTIWYKENTTKEGES